jgi:hypothetical protein
MKANHVSGNSLLAPPTSRSLVETCNDKVLTLFCGASALITTTLVSQPVWADLPDAGDVIPDGVEADSPIELGSALIRIAVQFIALMIGIIATLGVGAQIYKAFSEAKEKNGWEDFFKTAAIGVFVIVAVDALAILAFTYASEFNFDV